MKVPFRTNFQGQIRLHPAIDVGGLKNLAGGFDLTQHGRA